MGPEDELLEQEWTDRGIKLCELFIDPNVHSRRFQLLEDLVVDDSELITFPAGEIVNIYCFQPGQLKIQQFTGEPQSADLHNPNLRIVGREIVPFHHHDSDENKETAMDNFQKALGLTRDDLLFILSTFPPADRNFSHERTEAVKYANLFGSDRDKALLKAVKAERVLSQVGAHIFYNKFGKERCNKVFDADIEGKKVHVEIYPGSHGSWDFEVMVEIEGKAMIMRWTSMNDGPFQVNGIDFRDELLTLFDKKTPEFLFNYLVMELPDQPKRED